jgi:hypothetical protein
MAANVVRQLRTSGSAEFGTSCPVRPYSQIDEKRRASQLSGLSDDGQFSVILPVTWRGRRGWAGCAALEEAGRETCQMASDDLVTAWAGHHSRGSADSSE